MANSCFKMKNFQWVQQSIYKYVSIGSVKARENAMVTTSLENCTQVKAVVVQLATDQTLVATGSFQVLKVHLSS